MFDFFSLPQSSSMAASVDNLYDFIFWISAVSFIGVVAAILYFIYRYNRKKQDPDKTPYITGHHTAEIAVSIGLFIIVMIIFYWGWTDYQKMRQQEANALEINVVGKQWLWEFEYTNGRKLVNEVVVPKGRNVKLILSSSDVIHSFYVPNFRLKQDVVPGMYNFLNFRATQTGDNTVYCAEYCGTAHSKMLANLKVVEPQEYDRWQKKWEFNQQMGISEDEAKSTQPTQNGTAPADTPARRGEKLFVNKGCNACHTTTGQPSIGPSFKGLFGRKVELSDGSTVEADENYIRESIVNSTAQVVKGYQPIMPIYKGTLTTQEVNDLVGYIKSLAYAEPTPIPF